MMANRGLLFFLFLISIPVIAETHIDQTEGVNDFVILGDFSHRNLSGWYEKIFADQQTRYSFRAVDGDMALSAVGHHSASGLIKEVSIDIKSYPYLNWRWRLAKPLPAKNERDKAGDDYAARIYVMVSGGVLFWKTKALNYVWSSQEHKGNIWPNAFAPNNTRMVSARSSEDKQGVWYVEKYNVYDALKQWLGYEVSQIDAIAIMTDTDNTGGRAGAFYGDIYFSKN